MILSGSLHQRLIRFAMSVVAVACVIIAAIGLVSELIEEQEKLRHDLEVLFEVSSEALQPYIVFKDSAGASSHLQGLLKRPDILSARLDGLGDELVAEVRQDEKRFPPGPLPAVIALYPESGWLWGESVRISYPVKFEDAPVGALLLHIDLRSMREELFLRLLLVVLSLIMALVIAYVVARRLKGMIIAPIANIDRAARDIAASRRYDVRVPRTTDDELGRLTDSFNAMVTEVQVSEQEIKRHSHNLETQKGVLSTLINTLPHLVWLKDPEGRYLACNTRFKAFFGGREEEILGKTDYDFVGRELADSFRTHDQRVLEANRPLVNEGMVQFASDGHHELLETTRVPMRDAAGNLMGVLGIGQDITERRRTEDALRQAANVFEHANEGIMITDIDGTILDVNRGFTRITGYPREEVIGRNPRLLKSDRHGRELYKDFWDSLKNNGEWSGEIWNRRKDGDIFVELLTISAVRDAAGTVQRYVGLFSDITEIKENQKQLEHMAHYDLLTNLPNRALLHDRLDQAMARAERAGSLLAVVFLDLDGFKAINDQYSHDVGDRLLKVLSLRMKDALRDIDTLARLGGDEFVAVVLDLPSHEACVPILERMLEAASAAVRFDGLELYVSASIGVTFYPQVEPIEAEQLMRQADLAMYDAKQSGKNRYRLFNAEQDRLVRGQHESIERIRQALADNEFVLYYQPKVNLRSGQIFGAEALIRWQHPERGLLPPVAFLPLIEDHPVMVEIGEWVMEAALNQIVAWQQQGLSLQVSINIDSQQLEDIEFVEKLRARLATHPRIRPGDLELEVLETSALEDIDRVSEVIRICKTIGVGFALDDFGTGYSSLRYLKQLPAEVLKIDRGFVRNMLEDPDDLLILEGVCGLASSFQRRVVAEGVETTAHGRMLLRLGCDLAQGYAIARPMPAAAIPGWISSWQPDQAWREVGAVRREDLSIVFAEVGHRAWVNTMRRHLFEDGPRPPFGVSECRFCKWLDTVGREGFREHPKFPIAIDLNEKILRLADELANLHESGFTSQAQSRFGEITDLHDQLVACLEEWTRPPSLADSTLR